MLLILKYSTSKGAFYSPNDTLISPSIPSQQDIVDMGVWIYSCTDFLSTHTDFKGHC